MHDLGETLWRHSWQCVRVALKLLPIIVAVAPVALLMLMPLLDFQTIDSSRNSTKQAITAGNNHHDPPHHGLRDRLRDHDQLGSGANGCLLLALIAALCATFAAYYRLS